MPREGWHIAFPFSSTLYVAKAITRKHIVPKWGSWLLRDLTSGKIDAWIIQLRKDNELSSSSVNHILQAMRTMLGQAVFRRIYI